MKNVFAATVLLIVILTTGFVLASVVVGTNPPPAQSEAPTNAVVLPDGIEWETNLDDPPIGSSDAIRGGTFNYFMPSYPLTFRLMGPNSNDAFASWNRSFTMNFGLVGQHPVTDRYIPLMATNWSIQEDQRTIFFRLVDQIRLGPRGLRRGSVRFRRIEIGIDAARSG